MTHHIRLYFLFIALSCFCFTLNAQSNFGVNVYSFSNEKGYESLPYGDIKDLTGNPITQSDSFGMAQWSGTNDKQAIVVSALGYTSDTLNIFPNEYAKVILYPEVLESTVIQSRRNSRQLGVALNTTLLDQVPKSDLVNKFSKLAHQEHFNKMYLPFRNDAHSDHKIVYDSAITLAKSFRYKSLESIYVYETISETEYGFKPSLNFNPNLFIDISKFLKQKISIMNVYKNEILEFPFPRSEDCIESLAKLRGSQIDCNAAEAFMIIKEKK